MSLLIRGGVRRLSELEIDADKDWEEKVISNCGGAAAGMAIGHILQHNGVILETLAPGVADQVLTSAGPGHRVVWMPGGCYYNRYYPVAIDIIHSEGVFTPDHSESMPSDLDTALGVEDNLNPGWFETIEPALSRAKSHAIFTPDHSDVENCAIGTYLEVILPIGGAVADDGGVQTDETTEGKSNYAQFQNYTVNDDGAEDDHPNDWEAQTFTTAVAHNLHYVKLKLYRSGTPGNVTVAIKATDGLGHPTGPDLAVGAMNGNTLTTSSSGEWVIIWMVTPVALAAATKYAIIVEANANTVYWRRDGTVPAYAGGNREYSTDNGVSWNTDNTKDFMFEEWGTVNDMTLLPAAIVVNDAYYFGSPYKFYKLILMIGVAAAGTHTVAWEYWDGGAWQVCVGLTDGTDAFRNQWEQEVTHTVQAGWQTCVVQAMDLYWIRARVTNIGAGYSQPEGCFGKVVIQI
jgi:hypothetical protein